VTGRLEWSSSVVPHGLLAAPPRFDIDAAVVPFEVADRFERDVSCLAAEVFDFADGYSLDV